MKLIKYLVFLLLPTFMIGCGKEEVKETADEVGHSKVTNFPTFTMKGDQYLSVVKGGTYTEAGVTAKEGDKDLQITTTGTVNVNTVGVYDIVYSATNKDGFSGSVTRTVAVLPAAEQAGVDISGSYKNTGSFNYTAKISKLAPGFYLADNIWGGGSAAIIASYIITTNGTDLIIPLNTISPYGRVQGTGTLNSAGDLTYVVSLLDQGVNNSTRKWKKV
jgi:hypothetical protein